MTIISTFKSDSQKRGTRIKYQALYNKSPYKCYNRPTAKTAELTTRVGQRNSRFWVREPILFTDVSFNSIEKLWRRELQSISDYQRVQNWVSWPKQPNNFSWAKRKLAQNSNSNTTLPLFSRSFLASLRWQTARVGSSSEVSGFCHEDDAYFGDSAPGRYPLDTHHLGRHLHGLRGSGWAEFREDGGTISLLRSEIWYRISVWGKAWGLYRLLQICPQGN